MPRFIHILPRIAAALLAGGIAASSQAQEAADPNRVAGDHFDFALTGGLSQTDNIRRTPTDEESGNIARAGVQLAYRQDSRRLETDIDVNAAYEHYSDDVYDDDVVGGGDANLKFGIVPDRFNWIVQENFGQVTADPFSADTPDNRENINYFTTGPDFQVQFAGAMSMTLSARYSDFQYELRDVDGNQYGGNISLARQLSGGSTLSFNVAGDRFEFDNQITNSDYDRYQAYLRYAVDGARTVLSADAGYTQLDINDDSPTGLLARVALTRRMSRGSSLSLSVGSEFSSSGDLFREGQALQGASTDTSSVVGTSDPFTSRYASLGYSFERNRTAITASVRLERERYETVSPLDRDLTRWSLNFHRQMSAVAEFVVFGQLEQQEFQLVDFDSDDTHAGVYLNWSVGRRLSLRFQVDHFDRDTSDNDASYTENRASIFVTWSPLRGAGGGR